MAKRCIALQLQTLSRLLMAKNISSAYAHIKPMINKLLARRCSRCRTVGTDGCNQTSVCPKQVAQEEENWTPGDMTQAAGLPAAMHLALSQFNTTMLYDAMA